jgi:hypothetical protein
MNWRRGLFRLWLVTSFLWILWVILFDSASATCFQVRQRFGLGNPFDCFDPGTVILEFNTRTVLLLFGPVLGSFAAGLIVAWIVQGFSKPD